MGKEALCYRNEIRISFELSHPQPVCKDMNGKDISCEKNELKVAAKVIVQIRFETRNGKETFSRPEKKIEVWIEKRVLRGYGSGMSAVLTQ